MQTTVASLILVVSAVVIAGIVVDYAVNVVQATLQTTNLPQLDQLRAIQSDILNQTNDLLYGNMTQTPSPSGAPTAAP